MVYKLIFLGFLLLSTLGHQVPVPMLLGTIQQKQSQQKALVPVKMFLYGKLSWSCLSALSVESCLAGWTMRDWIPLALILEILSQQPWV